MSKELTFNTYKEFYHYYLSEHSNNTCRNLHYIGSSLVIIVLSISLYFDYYILLWSLPVIGYGFAWLGHFVFEHNKPATFKWPFWSLASDWLMLFQFVTRTLPKEHFHKK
mgnify:CR=1 FL=1